jgi:beta-glucosidase
LDTVNTAVGRVLKVKFMLGLFEKPYTDPNLHKSVVRCRDHGQIALQAARESICLLKNDCGILPLSKILSTVAVIGPSADHARLGDYTPFIEGFKPVTLLDGVKKLVSPDTRVLYAKGTGILANELTAIPMDCLFDEAGNSGLLAQYFNNPDFEGEPVLSRLDTGIHFNWVITKPDEQIESFNFSVRWTGKLVPKTDFNGFIGTVSQDSMRLWLNDQLLVDGWGSGKSATQSTAVSLKAGQAYKLRAEYCKDTNGVDVMLGWSSEAEDIGQAVQIASQADVAIVAVGDSERTCGEGVDRSSLDLPGNQLELLQAIHATGTPIILVLQNGRPITLGWESGHIPAIVEAWYAGENGGDAIAEVLFGDYNPAGRLPISFPATLGQIPVHYNRRRGGQKQYMEGDNRPLYAFGHGLSYTSFEYRKLSLSKSFIHAGEKVEVEVDVTNSGSRDGDEVVQLYVSDLVCSIARPDKELRHFQRIHLKAGETKTVSFTLSDKDFRLLNRKLEWVVEPGVFRIIAGPSSDQEAVSAELHILG